MVSPGPMYVPPLGPLPGDDEPDDRSEYAECCHDVCDACLQPACVDHVDGVTRCEHGFLLHAERECAAYCGPCADEVARDWYYR